MCRAFIQPQVINTLGGLPITSATFTTSGGTLLLFYSGSGYAQTPSRLIGMSIKLDGNLIDTTGIFSNSNLVYLAFVPKQWVMTGIAAGQHTITLEHLNLFTGSDGNDIYEVTVTEMPN